MLAVVGLLNSGLACFYYLRLLVAMYARHPHERGNDRYLYTKLSIPAGIGLAASALATLGLGILPGHVLNLSRRGADAVLSNAPSQQPVQQPAVTTSTRNDSQTGTRP